MTGVEIEVIEVVLRDLAVALLVEAVGGILVMGGDVSSNDC
jgi:hypothetical protein